jgi:hypothetical protein
MSLSLLDYVFRAMTYAQLDDRERARAAVTQILLLDPKYGEHVVADFRERNAHPSVVQAIVDGLAKAGLIAQAANQGIVSLLCGKVSSSPSSYRNSGCQLR